MLRGDPRARAAAVGKGVEGMGGGDIAAHAVVGRHGVVQSKPSQRSKSLAATT